MISMSFYHFCEFWTDYALPGHFLLQQADKASHIIDQIHHPDLDGCVGLANRPQLLTALLGERAKHMLDSGTVSGAPGVGPFLRFGQRSVAVGAFMYPVTVSLCLEQLLGFLRTVSAVGEDLPAGILRVQQGSPDTGCHAPRHRSRRIGESACGACPH